MGGGMRKKEKGLMDIDKSVVIAGHGLRTLNGKGKNTIK